MFFAGKYFQGQISDFLWIRSSASQRCGGPIPETRARAESAKRPRPWCNRGLPLPSRYWRPSQRGCGRLFMLSALQEPIRSTRSRALSINRAYEPHAAPGRLVQTCELRLRSKGKLLRKRSRRVL